MREREITQEALIPVLRVTTRGAVGHILTGRRQMSARQLLGLTQYFGVTVEDLCNGHDLNIEAIKLARAIEALPPESRAHLQAVTRAFTESQPWDGKLDRRKAK